MMNEKDKAVLSKLRKASRFEDEEDFEVYTECIDDLRNNLDPQILSEMLDCLHDNDAGEIQYELIEACEIYPDHIYIPIVIEKFDNLKAQAGIWFRLIFQSILNTESCRTELKNIWKNISQSKKEVIKSYVDSISDEESNYNEIIKSFDF